MPMDDFRLLYEAAPEHIRQAVIAAADGIAGTTVCETMINPATGILIVKAIVRRQDGRWDVRIPISAEIAGEDCKILRELMRRAIEGVARK